MAGIAGVIGGLALLIKAVMILATGHQPPLLFEIAPLFLACSLYGLVLAIPMPPGTVRSVSIALITVLGAAALIGLFVSDDAEPIGSLLDVASGLLPSVVLVVLGKFMWKRGTWIAPLNLLPLVLGLTLVPAIVIGAVLETAMGERYLEVPLVLVAVGWMVLGDRIRRADTEVA